MRDARDRGLSRTDILAKRYKAGEDTSLGSPIFGQIFELAAIYKRGG